MTKIKIKDVYNLIIKALSITPGGNLLVEVENGKKVVLYPLKKEGVVDKTAGILTTKTAGIRLENKLRRQEEERLKRENSK